MKLFGRSGTKQGEMAPAINTPVQTADGHEVGFVKDLQGGYFEVAASGGDNFWLSCDHLVKVADRAVTVDFDAASLGEHRLNNPGIEPQHDPDRAAIRDALLSDEEALEQRERMEQELLGQRGTIDTGTVTQDGPPDGR